MLSSQHCSDLYFSGCFHKALDATLYFVVVGLQEKVSQTDLLRTINEASYGISLAVKHVFRGILYARYSSWEGAEQAYNIRREELVSSSHKVTQSWEVTKWPQEGLTWAHVPSTNVS